MTAIAMRIDDEEDPVCLVCAEDIATKTGLPKLFWCSGHSVTVSAGAKCSCGKAYGEKEAQNVAFRVSSALASEETDF